MQLMRLADAPMDPHDRVDILPAPCHRGRDTPCHRRHRRICLCLDQRRVANVLHRRGDGALCLLLYQRLIFGRFRSSNWLLRMTDHGLYVKFRSYLNHHFAAEDLTVVFLPYSEMRSARMVKERQELPDRDQQSA